MFKRICKDCARLTAIGLVGVAVARLVRKRHEAEQRPLLHRLIPH
jgi:hypothetical protein